MPAINKVAINTSAINVNGETPIATLSGTLVSYEQTVVELLSGTLIAYEQTVEFLENLPAQTLISYEQQVIETLSGTLISYEQVVREVEVSSVIPSFFQRNGYELIFTLGGYTIPSHQIHNEITVQKEANDNSTLSFKIIPGSGTYNLYAYQGKEVMVTVRDSAGLYRIFKGRVNTPRINLIEEKIELNCVQDNEQFIRDNLSVAVKSIGRYSENVQGPVEDTLDEFEARMETVASSFSLDAYDNWYVTSWTPKATPDYTLGSSDVYYRQPNIEINSGENVINKVTINFSYLYQRLWQKELSYSFSNEGTIYSTTLRGQRGGQTGGSFCSTAKYGLTIPERQLIQSAVDATGWQIRNMQFTPVWTGGWYSCISDGIPFVAWSPIRYEFTIQNVTETVNSVGEGGIVSTEEIVLGSDGKPLKEAVISSVEDTGSLLCLGATWRARKRYSQNVNEQFNISVQNTASQALHGVKENTISYNLQSEFDPSEWEDEDNYDNTFSGTPITAPGDSTNYYINKDQETAEFNNAFITALEKAKVDILKSHKDSKIKYETPFTPRLELRHTVSLTGKWVTGKGVCNKIVHTFDTDTGYASTTVELSIFRIVGSSSEDVLTPPSRVTGPTPKTPATPSLGSRWGLDPSTAVAGNFTGFFGNTIYEDFEGNTFRTTYPVSFVVDTPAIPDNETQDNVISKSVSYNISIPQDNVNAIFYWDRPS